MPGEAPGAREERLHVVRAHPSAASQQSLDTSLDNETEGAAVAAEKRRDSSTRPRTASCAVVSRQKKSNRRKKIDAPTRSNAKIVRIVTLSLRETGC